jgi:hypothetical protein
MPFPDQPCAACPRVARGLSMPCRAMTTGHARFCTLAAGGHEGYVALLCDEVPPPPEFPSLVEQAAHLAGAVGRFVASGAKRASEEERARRMAICEGCENYAGGRCRLCGCQLHAKVLMLSEHCPISKW